MNATNVYFELGQRSLKMLAGETGLELPLERGADGRLTAETWRAVVAGVAGGLARKGWQARTRALVALGARGVSLRRITLPAAAREEQQRVLRLQVESEFPLPPDELAWGTQPVSGRGGGTGGQELLVAAVRKETLAEAVRLFAECGVQPLFTVGALAQATLCPVALEAFAILDLGRETSEITGFENGVAVMLRVLPWGGETVTQAIQKALGISYSEAERMKLRLNQESLPEGELGRLLEGAMRTALESLAALVKPALSGRRLLLTGQPARQRDWAPRLGACLGAGVNCELLPVPAGPGRSAAILGLQRSGATPPLVLHLSDTVAAGKVAEPAPLAWVVAGVALLAGCLILPFAEAWVRKPALARQLAALRAEEARLPLIDRELGFLEYLNTNQPAYSDALTVIANAAPGGAKIESLAMTRRGEVNLRGGMQNATQVTEFRKKLIDSGFFATVVVEEQAPTPDRQRVTVRMSAQWKPAAARVGLKIPVNASPNGGGGGAGGMPPGFTEMPAGMPMMDGPPPEAIMAVSTSRRAGGPRPGGPVLPGGTIVVAPGGAPEGVALPPGVVTFPGGGPPSPEMMEQMMKQMANQPQPPQ